MSGGNKGNNGFLWGMLAGVTAGALLGILYAPDKGSNTRAALKFKLAKYKEMLLEFIADLDTSGIHSEMKEESTEIVDDVKHSAEKLLEEIEALIHKVTSGKS
jgi:gas vesicle protein